MNSPLVLLLSIYSSFLHYMNSSLYDLRSSPETFDDRAKAVKATWLPRCDRANLFYSNDSWSFLSGAVPLHVPEGKKISSPIDTVVCHTGGVSIYMT